jgi:hypothetical protein
MLKIKTLVAVTAMVAWTGAAQAALIKRSGGMIYDTTYDITWLADMNYAKTSSHTGTGVSVDGTMTWNAAQDWAESLIYGGFDDWRLPWINPSDTTCSDVLLVWDVYPLYYGTGCTGARLDSGGLGEMTHLFVTELGNKAGESVLNQTDDTAEQIANLALFSNVQSDAYWSYNLGIASYLSFDFVTSDGSQYFTAVNNRLFAVAVHPGDVAPPEVPLPGTLGLLGVGLVGLGLARKRRG